MSTILLYIYVARDENLKPSKKCFNRLMKKYRPFPYDNFRSTFKNNILVI